MNCGHCGTGPFLTLLGFQDHVAECPARIADCECTAGKCDGPPGVACRLTGYAAMGAAPEEQKP